ncbi:MAG: polymer-forming cytoskeletal protein [Comamonadaceae bacterium]
MTAASTNRPAPASGSQDNILIIGAGFSIEGHVHGQGTLLVSGSINGDVKADTVKLTETAHVSGHIECTQLDVAGRLDGSFQSDDVVVQVRGVIITATESISRGTCMVAGSVSGQLKANQLKVETTGRLSGQTIALQMDLHGHVQGEVTVDDLVMRSSASLNGNLRYGNLSMERGSDVTGQIERKSGRSVPPVTKATDTVVMHLPANIVQQLRKNPDDLKLNLANGDPVPTWITVDREHDRLVLNKADLDQFCALGETVMVRLQAGSENLVFKLPPETK